MQIYQHYARLEADEAFRELASSPAGITAVESLRRRAESGPNEFLHRGTSMRELIRRQLATPLVGLLLVAALVAALLKESADAVTILAILLINSVLGFFQEFRSEHATRALQQYLRGTARVLRAGALSVISRAEIVPGDVVMLRAGDLVPADARIITAAQVQIDESSLSGESEPVAKDEEAVSGDREDIHAATDIVFSGTTVVGGELQAVVFATGRATEFGRISALATAARRRSSFEENVAAFSRFIFAIVGATLLLLFVVNLLIQGSAARAGELLLFSLALAISVVPEALPVVMTITFSRGALHLARRHVVVRRLSSIEDLGHIDILCTDKTGTITENRMRLAAVFSADEDRCLRLAAESIPAPAGDEPSDPFERAIWNRSPAARMSALRTRPIFGSIGFDHHRRRMSVIVPATERSESGALLIVRGAPEVVLERSTHQDGQVLTAARREEILRAFSSFGHKGYRTLGIAVKPASMTGPWNERDETALEWIGLIAFEDPLKPTARAAIALAEQLNVRVKILTGDSREVAGAVAKEVGIIGNSEAVMTGAELERLDAAAFARAAREHDVFARVSPEQKYKIIDVLQHEHAVGFLGEGINDAPALKLATVALAVPSAADISKNIADVLLLDRSLGVVVDGIREGRAIVSNVAKYIRYSLAGNFGNFISIATISLFIPYLPMLPAQILLTNLLTDLPLIALAGDRVQTAELSRPRRLNIKDLVFSAMILGLVSAVFDLALFARYRAAPPAILQTNWFVFSILAELATIFVIRTSLPIWRARAPSSMLVGATIAAAAVSVALPYLPFGQQLFHLVPPAPEDLVVIGVLLVLVVAMTELVKRLLRRYFHTS